MIESSLTKYVCVIESSKQLHKSGLAKLENDGHARIGIRIRKRIKIYG